MSQPTADSAVNPKLLYALAAVVVLAVVFMFVVRPLLAGDEVDPAPVPSASEDRSPALDDDDETDEEDADPLPETDEVFSARDPFQQLVSAEVEGSADESDTSDGAATATPASNTDAAGEPAEGGEAKPDADAQVGSTAVRLVDVFTGDDGDARVLVTVNGTGYEVGQGQDFAERLRLLDVKDRCATFLFGDNRFVLCEGEQIRK